MRYAVELEAFRNQLDWMKGAGYRGVALGQVIDGLAGQEAIRNRDVVMTFDDGNYSDYIHAFPMLAERGFRATFFIGGNRIGAEHGLEEGMVREMRAGGMEIGSHAMTHRFLTLLGPEEQRTECARSKEILESLCNQPVRFFAPPGGRYNGDTLAILRELSFAAVCTSRFGYASSGDDLYRLRRIPIMRETTHSAFGGLVSRSARAALPGYVKAGVLAAARAVLTENGYARARSLFVKE